MAYVDPNFKTKRALVEAFKSGKPISVFQPGPFGPDVADGIVSLKGPHYPEPHRWYAQAEIVNGQIVKIK